MTPQRDRGARRRRRLEEALLYVVTGTRDDRGDLRAFLEAVLRGGADVIQLREKNAEASVLLRAGAVFQRAAAEHGALFIVNDRPDIAVALDADGVHLGQDDLPVPVARRIVGRDAIIGQSTHSPAQFEGADGDSDYICAGPVFATPTKSGRPPTGLELVRSAADRARRHVERRPWFAIGGLDVTTLPAVVAAGAERAVVVRAADTDDPEAAVRVLRAALGSALHNADEQRENVYGS